MSRYRDQVVEAASAVEILGPLRYAWLGVRSRAVPAPVRRALSPDEQRAKLRSFVAEQLYWSFYCCGRVVPARWGAPEAVAADPRLVTAIAAAGASLRHGPPEWTVQRVDGGTAVVSAKGVRARAPLAACRADGPLMPGTAVRLPAAPQPTPGDRTITGDAGSVTGEAVRVYWHVVHAGAASLAHAMATKLNAERVPFRLKVVDHPSRFDRCDAAVLFVTPAAFCDLRAWFASLGAESAPLLRPHVPAFTFPLAPGVGLAEDAGGRSFGERRCAWLAEGILEAHERGGSSVDAVAARFARAGVDLDHPYREPALTGPHVL